jgi:type I restriction enzyme S subunit
MSTETATPTKPSGIPWLGDIPKHWVVRRLAYIGEFRKGRGIARADITDDGVPAVLYGDIYTQYELKTDRLVRKTSEEVAAGAEEIAFGDLLLTGSGETKEDIGKCVVYLGKEQGYAGGDVIILRQNKADSLFLSYVLNSTPAVGQKTQMGKGEIVVHIYPSDLRDLVFVLPPLPEQRAIAAFLDERTARIDGLIARKQRLVALLREKRQALITRAVTRGLDPKVKVKESGVPWLGMVPEHWGVKRLKHIARLRSGEAITATDIEAEGSYPVYGGNGLRGYADAFTHEGDHVLIGRQGALCGNVNYASGKFWASEHAVVCHLQMEADHYWLGELLRFMDLNQYSLSAAQPGLAIERIEALLIPVPPVDEQRHIAAMLKCEENQTNALIAKVEAAVQRLVEYRVALISAAVTGKVRVPIGRSDDQTIRQ